MESKQRLPNSSQTILICELIVNLFHITLGMYFEHKIVFFPTLVMLQEWIRYFILTSLLNIFSEI